MNMGRESFCWARLREDKEATEARCQPADSPWSGDTFVDRMPVARNVCAACQRESLGKDGSCWNAETPNRQGLRYVLVLGELVGGVSQLHLRRLGVCSALSDWNYSLLNTWERVPRGAAMQNADGGHMVWPRGGNCTAQLCKQRPHRRAEGEWDSASSYFETRSTAPQMCLRCKDSSPYWVTWDQNA